MNKPRVLIADESAFVRKVVRQFLSNAQLEIHEVESGLLVLDQARQIRPDLIILDARMRGVGGKSILDAIKWEDGLNSIPIILMKESAHTGPDVETGLGGQKILGILKKPLDGNLLRKSTNKALNIISPLEDGSEYSSWQMGTSAQPDAPNFDDFTDYDFTRFQDFLMRKIGLFFDIKRKTDLARALSRRMKSMGIPSYSAYFDTLNLSAFEERELKNLILHLTIGETTFFRSPDQFVALKGFILPKILEKRRTQANPSLRIWSAGCSTGEEPYSIAIALKELIPDLDRWDLSIFATDINNKFLKFAERGIYPSRKVRFVKEDILARYFSFDGEGYMVDPALRKYIKFDYHNLSEENYNQYFGLDVIFCRNVLIYFKRDRIREVIDRFRDVLSVDGYLMLGYSETLFQISDDFASIHFGDAFFYRRMGAQEKEENRRQSEMPDEFVKNFINNRLSLVTSRPDTEANVTNGSPPPNLFSERPIKLAPPSTIPAPPSPSFPVVSEAPLRVAPAARSDFSAEPTQSELALWEEGMDHYFQERFQEAEDTFGVLNANHPNSARANLGKAFILANHGEDQAALDMIERAFLRDVLLPEAYYLRALLREKNGQADAALKDYQNVILLDPDFAMAHFNLAILYMKRNMIRDSRRELANTLNILKRYERHHQVKFSGGLHREALIQLCQELKE